MQMENGEKSGILNLLQNSVEKEQMNELIIKEKLAISKYIYFFFCGICVLFYQS